MAGEQVVTGNKRTVPSRYMHATSARSVSRSKDSSRHQNSRGGKSETNEGHEASAASSQLQRAPEADVAYLQAAEGANSPLETAFGGNSTDPNEPDFIESDDVSGHYRHGRLEAVAESPGPQGSQPYVLYAGDDHKLQASAKDDAVVESVYSSTSSPIHTVSRAQRKQPVSQICSPLHTSQPGKIRTAGDTKAPGLTNLSSGPLSHSASSPRARTDASNRLSRKGKLSQTVAQSAPVSPRTSFSPPTGGNQQSGPSQGNGEHALPAMRIRTSRAKGPGSVASSAPQSPAYSTGSAFSRDSRLSTAGRGQLSFDRPPEMKLVKDMNVEEVETLKDLLANGLLQWRYILAKKRASMAAQEQIAQRQIYKTMSIVEAKRKAAVELQNKVYALELESRTRSFMEAHDSSLAAWSSSKADHMAALNETVQAISNISLCIPLTQGAKAEADKLLPVLKGANNALFEAREPLQEFAPTLKQATDLLSSVGRSVTEMENALEDGGDEIAALCDRELQVVSLRANVVQSAPVAGNHVSCHAGERSEGRNSG